MKPLFIVDVDNTVCDSAHFVKKLSEKFKKHVDFWNEEQMRLFWDEVSNYKVLPGAEILPKLLADGICDIIFLTGRSEKIGRSRHLGRRLTVDWLYKKLGIPKNIPLFMRPPDNYGNPSAIKFEVFEKLVLPNNKDRVFVFLDDDVELLKLYSKYGLALKSPECWKAFWRA